MTPDRRGPAYDDDPVAHFFAEHRAAVREEPATDLTWQRVVHSRRPRRSHHRLRSFLAASAAAAVAVFGVWSWQQHPFGTGGVRPGQQISGSADYAASVASGPSNSTQVPGPVPSSFASWSVSNAGNGTLYDLGSAVCGQQVCPTLLRSADNGSTWRSVHTFAGTDTSQAVGSARPLIQPNRAVTEVRFATPQIGYAFGGALWVTSDGGASFQQVDHPGQAVLGLEVSRNQVMVLSADDCSAGVCRGPIYLSRTTPQAGSAALTTIASADVGTPLRGALLAVQDGVTVVSPIPQKAGTPIPPLVPAPDGNLDTIPSPQGCGTAPLESIALASNVSRLMWGLCAVSSTATTTTYSVLRSTDAGNRWSVAGNRTLTMPRLGRVTLAAADQAHLVATAGGPRSGSATGASSAGALVVSANGGRSFAPPTSAAPVPSSGFDWSASPGSSEFYAVPRTTAGYWWSTDRGRTWKVVDPTS
ncbi:hypothetical protein G9U51_14010 [Calidifontibacter sp. DB0510]|uniref:Uncharacterized protein n=1 Tax=Metallococcus carri TaxID=1656884 RepID=A0A967B236_9MICO|nr:hypothetical protein [Metallococcus carri]NHN56888.1 hypothetical protein [Metallococcus carri]NOP37633.1 hypothetical protein [Calidifontibacter sp. DB2511S]